MVVAITNITITGVYIRVKFAKIRKTTQLTSLAINSVIFAVALYGIILLGKNPLLVSSDKLASIGGFIVFICIATTLLISIPLGIIYMPRTWCSFCPVGYAQSLLSKNRILHMSIEDCRNCKKCHTSCHLDICKDYTGKSRTIEHPDCFACMKCSDACKSGANKPIISLKPVN
ncbi:MAG: hypothetical protein OIN66_01305 [Candidatus Methanoperedens sp.]|nr:hypothetical protein [Candidatus Methanoperedens sp.]